MTPYQGGSWWNSYVWHQVGTKIRVVQFHWAGHQPKILTSDLTWFTGAFLEITPA